jgi:hypothetical protein
MMGIRVANTEFELNRVTLERIEYDLANLGGLIVEFDDTTGARIRLLFSTISGVHFVHENYMDYGKLAVDNKFPKRLLEIDPPEWGEHYSSVSEAEIKNRLDTDVYRLRHFVLPFEDYTLEILASGHEVKDLSKGNIENS